MHHPWGRIILCLELLVYTFIYTIFSYVIFFSGLIGQNWSMIFASCGYKVSVFDVDQGQITRAEKNISVTLTQYEKDGFLRGEIPATEQTKLVTFTSSLQDCLSGAIYVQVGHKCEIHVILSIFHRCLQCVDNSVSFSC